MKIKSVLFMFLILASTASAVEGVRSCGKVLEGFVQVVAEDGYWSKLGLRFTYRDMLYAHLKKQGIDPTPEKLAAIEAYLDTLLPKAGSWVKVSWEDFGMQLGSSAGVYDPARREVVWNSAPAHVAAAYNPLTGQIQMRRSSKIKYAGAFNPVLGKVEWFESEDHSIAAVFDPFKGDIRLAEGDKGKLVGVYNPITHKPDWHGLPYYSESGEVLGDVTNYAGVVEVIRPKR